MLPIPLLQYKAVCRFVAMTILPDQPLPAHDPLYLINFSCGKQNNQVFSFYRSAEKRSIQDMSKGEITVHGVCTAFHKLYAASRFNSVPQIQENSPMYPQPRLMQHYAGLWMVSHTAANPHSDTIRPFLLVDYANGVRNNFILRW